MSGVFQIDRAIFDNGIWNNVAEFRLFFYILGKAIWKVEGVRVGNILVGKGQYLRSYRNLRQDLMYIENNAIKYYGIATIKRIVDKLVVDGRIEKRETELGTLFTVVNYTKYQSFARFKKEYLEQQRNISETAVEQPRNNKKNVNKDNKETLSKISSKFNEDTNEYILAEYLYKSILANDSKTKKPNLYRWAEDIDKLMRLDERSKEDIRAVIEFATRDDFWKTNILSANSLRAKFPQLHLKAKQINNSSKVIPVSWKVDAS